MSNDKFNDKFKKYLSEQGKSREKLINKQFNKEYVDSQEENRLKLVYVTVEILLAIFGFLLVGYHTNGWVVIGLFLLIFSNNLSITRSLVSKKENKMKDIWKNDR